MKNKTVFPLVICGAAAGAVNGLFGAGGGMVLVPLLTWLTDLKDNEIFPASVAIIAPLCVVSLLLTANPESFSWKALIPYLIGSIVGGILAGLFAKKIPTGFLHKLLGMLILWGGVRYLC